MVRGAVEHPVKNVSVVYLQVPGGLDAHGVVDKGLVAGDRKLAGGHHDQHDPIANDGRTPGDQPRRAALHHQTSNILRILVIVWQAREINPPQHIGLKTGYRSDQQIMPEIEHPVAAISVLQANSIVVPNIVSVNLGTLKYEMLSLRSPIKMEVLRCVADVGSRHNTSIFIGNRRESISYFRVPRLTLTIFG